MSAISAAFQPWAGSPGAEHPWSEARVAFWLGRLRPEASRVAGPLEIFPLRLEGAPGPSYLLLHQAVKAGHVEVVEQGGGVVNEVVVCNRGPAPVLVPEGSSLVGAKQNRVVVETTLIGPVQTVPVKVGCVQQGRWGGASSRFAVGDLPVEPALRRHTVAEAAAKGHVDQGRLWADVARALSAHGVRSATGDYMAGAAAHRREAEDRARAFDQVPGEVGILALAHGRLLGLEVFGHPDTWAALRPVVMPSYLLAVEALALQPGARAGAPERAGTDWIARIATALVQARPSRGLGAQLALTGRGFAGAGLWAADALAHLAVFGE
ncbi:MAG: hypothetical protein HZC42_13970 [Candidatus Eisenbacteria bacterium]|nr:hypothetical protein [Candidatus Eisenbacteria bacterium]